MNHQPLLNGLVFLIRITPQRGSGVLGTLEDNTTGEVVFESDFPSYRDAYWALMEMDGNEYLGSLANRPLAVVTELNGSPVDSIEEEMARRLS